MFHFYCGSGALVNVVLLFPQKVRTYELHRHLPLLISPSSALSQQGGLSHLSFQAELLS